MWVWVRVWVCIRERERERERELNPPYRIRSAVLDYARQAGYFDADDVPL